jgi:Fibronectin type III domain
VAQSRFSLVQAPSGAALSGDTVNWTPTAAQSRVSNSFTLRATTSEGGTASQSWTVSPRGTVTVTSYTTAWGPAGTKQIPPNPQITIFALVPQSDGSLVSIPSTQNPPGVYTIPNVPAGYYWLMSKPNSLIAADGFWTSTSNFDLGSDVAASLFSSLLPNNQTTTLDLDLAGLDSTTPAGNVLFLTDNAVTQTAILPSPAGASTLSTSISFLGPEDWSEVDTVFLLQSKPISAGILNLMVLGPELTLSNLNLVSGTTNTIAGTLQASSPTSLDVNILGSQWASLFQNIGPNAASPSGSWYSVQVRPFFTGQNTHSVSVGPNLLMVSPNPQSEIDFFLGACPDTPFAHASLWLPAITTDQDFGMVQYNDPFPSSWERVVTFCEGMVVPQSASVGGNTLNFSVSVIDGVSITPSNSPIAPPARPVQSPTLNGANLFAATTLNTTAVTLSWAPPSAGTPPFGYSVQVMTVSGTPSVTNLNAAGIFFTAKTSITLPPLIPGKVYLFMISSEVDGRANMESSPYRSALPTGYARVVSAPITITDGATGPIIH